MGFPPRRACLRGGAFSLAGRLCGMVELTADECRVLGVLVEKAQTTPAQYPITVNGLVNGASQKNNRHPVVRYTEERVFAALDGLRAKGLAREVDMAGSRVAKFRHVAREALSISTQELVILAELLLRGPQSVGEIRGRASRMFALESLEVVQSALDSMAGRESPLVKNIGRAPGSRAERWAHVLSPLSAQAAPEAEESDEDRGGGGARAAAAGGLESRVARLEAELAEIKGLLRGLSGTEKNG